MVNLRDFWPVNKRRPSFIPDLKSKIAVDLHPEWFGWASFIAFFKITFLLKPVCPGWSLLEQPTAEQGTSEEPSSAGSFGAPGRRWAVCASSQCHAFRQMGIPFFDCYVGKILFPWIDEVSRYLITLCGLKSIGISKDLVLCWVLLHISLECNWEHLNYASEVWWLEHIL